MFAQELVHPKYGNPAKKIFRKEPMENRTEPTILTADEAARALKTTLVTTRHLLATGS